MTWLRCQANAYVFLQINSDPFRLAPWTFWTSCLNIASRCEGTKKSHHRKGASSKELIVKNTKWMLPVMLMLVSGLMSAQSLTQQSVVSQVPFNFMVGDKMIPAGECSIKAADANGRVLAVRNYDAKISAMVSSHPGSSSAGNSTVLVFKSYGDRY